MLEQLKTILSSKNKEKDEKRQPVLPRRFGSLHKNSTASLEEHGAQENRPPGQGAATGDNGLAADKNAQTRSLEEINENPSSNRSNEEVPLAGGHLMGSSESAFDPKKVKEGILV